jgi:hypothetical protein
MNISDNFYTVLERTEDGTFRMILFDVNEQGVRSVAEIMDGTDPEQMLEINPEDVLLIHVEDRFLPKSWRVIKKMQVARQLAADLEEAWERVADLEDATRVLKNSINTAQRELLDYLKADIL